jgi:hypothetical protein
MGEIKQGDVIHYKSDGRGGKFDGNLYVLCVTKDKYIGIDENSKDHSFARNNPLATATRTGLQFKTQDEFLEYFQNKNGDMTLEELLACNSYTRGRRRGHPISDEDVRLTLIRNKDEGRSGQFSLLIYKPFEGFSAEDRFCIIWPERRNPDRLYIFKADKSNDMSRKIQTSGRHPKIAFSDAGLYKKLKSEGIESLRCKWKFDAVCNTYYIPLKEVSE